MYGHSFIDSTRLSVCHNARIHQYRVFARRAAHGKTSLGWFYGFKLHLVVNGQGELLAFCLTQGNVDDRRPIPKLIKGLKDLLFGDKGYLSKPPPEHLLVTDRIHFITKLRRQMRNCLLDLLNKHLLRKPAIIKTININFLVNLVVWLIAYCHLPKKLSLRLQPYPLPPA